jgi:hypothetical protein
MGQGMHNNTKFNTETASTPLNADNKRVAKYGSSVTYFISTYPQNSRGGFRRVRVAYRILTVIDAGQ